MAAQKFRTPNGVEYFYVKEPKDAEEALRHLITQKVVGHDVETTGTDPHKDKVILSAFSSKERNYVIDTRNLNNLRIMAPVFENEDIYKIEHNAVFEYQMVKGSIGVDIENNICTMLGERALTAGLQLSGFDLASVSKKYVGVERDKTLQKSFIGHTGDFTQAQLDYSAEDTADMIPIAKVMQEKAKLQGVLTAWQIENGAIPAFGDIEFYGQKIDADKWRAIMAFNHEAALKAKKDLDKWFIPIVGTDLFGAAGIEDQEAGLGGAAINYDSVPEVLRALKMMGIKVDGETIQNTNKKTQKKIKHYDPILALTAYRSAVKLEGTYGQKYLDRIHPVTGRVHFRFNQYGTDTGRPSCRGGLNCLNIPRDKRYREAFITDPDRLISTVDYSAAELRILADLSGDKLMIDGFNSGIDFHCFVASMLFGVEVTKKNENKHFRDPTKTLNFGIAYGMSPFSLFEKLKYEMGQNITLEECEDLFNRYNKTFHEAVGWLKAQQQLASTQFRMANINGRQRGWFQPNKEKIKLAAIAELTQKGKLKLTEDQLNHDLPSLIKDKTRAHLAAVQREGANCQIQSVNADFTKRSMAVIRKEFKKRGIDSRMYNSVYDEIVMDSHKDCAEEAHALQKKIMVEEANKMLKHVPMEVEGHLASCWTK